MSGTAIACASGGFRGAFVHGVLTAFEEQGFRADVDVTGADMAGLTALYDHGREKGRGFAF